MQTWKPGNMLYPVPAVFVSCSDNKGNDNLITVAWTGTVCSDPAMVYISVRPERYSYNIIKESKEFVIGLPTVKIADKLDFCGVRSGRDVDKWKKCNLTKEAAVKIKTPLIKECPVNLECKVTQVIKLGSHDMFLAEVMAVDVDEQYMDKKGKFNLSEAGLLTYSHGDYMALGKKIGKFGFSVKKRR